MTILKYLISGRRRYFYQRTITTLLLCVAILLGVVSIALPQLPEGATVSALGRTALVRSDGTFRISNIPANIGNFRVRMVALDGTTAESDCLVPVLRGTTVIPPLVFGPLTPLADSLTVNSPTDIFTTIGDTAQLQVIGNLADSSTTDLTNDSCTSYTSSNTNLATVDTSGLVTANNILSSPATVIISVMNEGVVGTFSFLLNPTPADTDVDGDGMPNDWELRNGLDPTNPFDANQDPDFDGLTNLQEFQQNTDPNIADTDNDGISDGASDPDGAGPIIAGPDADPLVPEMTPPTVSITAPLDGDTVLEGQTINMRVDAFDNVAVSRVDFLVDGVTQFSDTSPPFEFPLLVPTGPLDLTLQAQVFDIAGNTAGSPPVVVNVIPDPLTTVIGTVGITNGVFTPLDGADVFALNLSGVTGPDGTFSIPNVPTALGDIVVNAIFDSRTGSSAPTPPVFGGTTDVGDIIVTSVAFEENLGVFNPLSDDGAVFFPLPFSFPYYGQNYNGVFVNNNGNLTFNFGDGDFTESVSQFLGGQPRIAPFWDDLRNDFGNSASGVYLNSQIPGQAVVTWFEELEYNQIPGPNTIQAILFDDGRIQFGYRGVSSLDAIVGISPGGNPPSTAVDFSSLPTFSTNLGEAVYEQFEVPNPRGNTDPTGAGRNSSRNNPFDLDGGFVVFDPNTSGGYNVDVVGSSLEALLNHGIITGTVFDESGYGLQSVEVEVRTSSAPTFMALTNTDAQGHYTFSDVPCGGGMVTVKATWQGNEVGLGVGTLPVSIGTIVIDLNPVPPAPPK